MSFKSIFRTLARDWRSSALNLIGLVLGATGSLLLLQFVLHEQSYDGFHTHGARLFRVSMDVYRDNKRSLESALNYLQTGPVLAETFGEVEAFTRLFNGESTLTFGADHYREEKAYFADATFFQLFSFPLVHGDPASALKAPYSAAFSRTLAKQYFGTEDCVGQTFEARTGLLGGRFTVTAIFEDFPLNTHLEGGIFYSLSTATAQPNLVPDWGWRDFYTYILLRESADAQTFAQKISGKDWIGAQYEGFGQRHMTHQLHLQPVGDIYLKSDLSHEILPGGDAKTLGYLGMIAFFILLMAWVNYVNLATAKAFERRKEVGVRKAIGAGRAHLMAHWLGAAAVLNTAAFVLALGLARALCPVLEWLVDKPLLSLWDHGLRVALGLPALLLIGVLFSGFYPAWLISGFKPAFALHLAAAPSFLKGGGVRKTLIVFQFSMSVALILATLTVFRQVRHMRQVDLGLDVSQTLLTRAPVPADSVAQARYQVFKTELLKNPQILGVAASHVVPGDESYWTIGVRHYGSTGPANVTGASLFSNAVEPEFFKQYGLSIREGRAFSSERPADAQTALLSENAVERLGFGSAAEALNQRLVFIGDTFQIIGVTADFYHFGARRAAEPYMFFMRGDEYRRYSIKVRTEHLPQTIEAVRNAYMAIFPGAAFEYGFADELFDRQYGADQRLGRIFLAFAGLAILIACLGLFGLATFYALQRTKEIGIRKVLGASVVGIMRLLATDFLKLVLVAIVVASPVAYYFMEKWLSDFAHRIEMAWWMFAGAGLLALLIAFLTVGAQSVRAALANPVRSLRNE